MSRPKIAAMLLSTPDRAAFFERTLLQISRFSVVPDYLHIDRDPSADVGTKRQRALENIPNWVDIVVMLDDDDWHHPRRIEKQLAALAGANTPIVGLVGTCNFYVHDIRTGRVTYSRTWGGATCMPAGSMAYWRKPALEIGFHAGLCAEEPFQAAWSVLFKTLGVLDMKDPSLFVHQRHGKNVSPDSWVLNLCDVPHAELWHELGESWFSRET